MDKYIKIASLGRGTNGDVYMVKNKYSLKVFSYLYKLFALKKVVLKKYEKKQSIKIENEVN